jgi:hypothetical protein
VSLGNLLTELQDKKADQIQECADYGHERHDEQTNVVRPPLRAAELELPFMVVECRVA